MIPTIRRSALAILISSTLVACGSSDSGSVDYAIANTSTADDRPGLIVTGLNDRSAEDINVQWLVTTRNFRDETETPSGYVRASLFEYDTLSMLDIIDFYEPDAPSLGECDIEINQTTTGGGTGGGGETSSPPNISGGESLSINTPEGVWMTLFSDGEAEPEYETIGGLPGAIPTNATLNIPGGGRFPTVANYPIAAPQAPVRLSPDSEQWITSESLFSWMPTNDANDTIGIRINGYSSDNGSFVETIAWCSSPDDGNFELPDDLKQEMSDYDGLLNVVYYRRATRVDLIDNVAFYQSGSVVE